MNAATPGLSSDRKLDLSVKMHGVGGLLFAMDALLRWELDNVAAKDEPAVASLNALVGSARNLVTEALEIVDGP